MKPLFFLCLSLTMLLACGNDPADEYREASPSRQGLTLEVGSTKKGKKVQGLGDAPTAPLYSATAHVTGTINSGVGSVLDTVEDIIQSPPAAIDEHHAVWGPITDPLSPMVLRFIVQRDQASMRYVLAGKPKNADDSAYVPVLVGEHHGDVSTGNVVGRFVLNHAAMSALKGEPADLNGQEVEFARSGQGDMTIRVLLGNVVNDGTLQPTNVAYVFAQGADGNGAFEFHTQRDLNENGVLEHFAIRARWNATGAGQAEASATGGDLQQNTAGLVQCWDGSFALTFSADSSGMSAPMGDPSTCTFAQQPPPAPPVP